MSRESLEELFERYVRDMDENAIATLVRRSRPKLLAAARRIWPSDADDCVQTAYLSLLHKRQEGMDAPVLPWLITAVVRIAYRHKAQHKRQLALAEHLSRSGREAPRATNLANALRTRVDQLPSQYRDAVILHYIEGVSTEDAARLLEISRDAFKKRLQRARAFLRSTWHPRALHLLLALPWFLTDAASAAAIGGLLMTKKAVVAVVLAVVALGTTTLLLQRTERPSTPRSNEAAQRRVDPTSASTTRTEADVVSEPKPGLQAKRTGYFGVVVDKAGAPVANALVELRKLFVRGQKSPFHRDREPVAQTSIRTENNGDFQLDNLWRKLEQVIAAELHVVADGHPRTIARVNRNVASRIVLGPGGRLRVVVRDEKGALVEGVTAMLCDGEHLDTIPPRPPSVVVKAKTDAQGAVAYHISPGHYRIEVHATGYTPINTEPFAIAPKSNRTLDLVLKRGTLFEVHVVDEKNKDIEGAQVEARGLRRSGGTATTDRRGRCQIGGIAPPPADGDYWKSRMFWHVEAEGFASGEGSRRLATKPGRERIQVVLRRGVAVVVHVVDAAGRPLEGASVVGSYDRNMANTIQRRFSAVAGKDGRATLPRMSPGKRVLGVYKNTFARKNVELEVGTEPIEKRVVLARARSTIRGVVLLPDGTKASGGKIGFALDDSNQRALGMICIFSIGTDGSFEVKRATTGVGKLFAIASGFGAQSWPATVREGADHNDVILQLRELGSISGKITDRKGTALQGIPVRLHQQIKVLGGGTSSHDMAEAYSQEDGAFRFRGVTNGEYTMYAGSKEWIQANAFGLSVKPGALDLVVKMKPASEGSGIKLIVLLPTPVEKITAYHGDKGWPHWMRAKKKSDGQAEFRIYHGPGIYDFTFEAPGHLPFEVKGVRIKDGPDNPPLEVRFVRGAVLHLRVVDAEGTPLRNEAVSYMNQVVHTDENAECEFGGFKPGAHDIYLVLLSDRYTYARVPGVRVPGRETITVLRHAHVYVKHTMTYGDLEKGARWKLIDAAGNVVDELVFDMSRIGHGYAKDRKVSGWLRTTRAGKYRVVAEIDDQRAEQTVDVPLGQRTTLELEPR